MTNWKIPSKDPKIQAKREYKRRYHKKIRNRVLKHYGGEIPKCACCGESTTEFLSIDHIEGRKVFNIKHGNGRELSYNDSCQGNGFYLRIIRLRYPNDLQILCHNCNQAKGHYGKCPHEELKELNDLLSNKIPELLHANSESK